MNNAKLSFCLRAVKTLCDTDLGTLTDSIEAYVQAGMPAAEAAPAAVADLRAAVLAEREDLVQLLRAQHPGCFSKQHDAATMPHGG